MLRTIRWPGYAFFGVCLALCSAQSCLTGTSSNRPGILGVYTNDATVSSVGGVLVTGVTPGAAAETVGLRANDIIARFDTKVVTSVTDLRQKIVAKTLNSTARMVFFRSTDPTPATVNVPLGANAAGVLPNPLGFAVSVGSSALDVAVLDPTGIAAQAGLKLNDHIISVSGSPTTSLADAWRLLANLTSGDSVTLRYTREGTPVTQAGVTPTFDLALKAGTDAASWIPVPGLYVQDLTPEIAAHFGYVEKTGAEVTSLYRESPALAAGLLVGDIIMKLTPLDNTDGEQKVTSATTLASLVTNYDGQRVRLRYARGQLPPTSVDLSLSGVPAEATATPEIGMLLEQLTDDAGNPTLLRVEQVTTDGPAATAAIVRDERITIVGTTAVKSIADFWNALLAEYDAGNLNVVLQVTPVTGSPRYVVLKLTAV